MNDIRLIEGLPFVSLEVTYKGNDAIFQNVLVDTGSAGTILKFDILMDIGVEIEDSDMIETIRGVGGTELVVTKKIDRLKIGDLSVGNFVIETGAMDYGFDIDGIIGMDFLLENRAILDLYKMFLTKSEKKG